jgi:hypothetical protein
MSIYFKKLCSFLSPPTFNPVFPVGDLNDTWEYHNRLSRNGVYNHPDSLSAGPQHLEVMKGRRIKTQREIYDQHLIACRVCAEEAKEESPALCVVGRELKRRVQKELPPRSNL